MAREKRESAWWSLLAGVLAVVALAVLAPSALATAPYGQVSHFGEFTYPVGFAVDSNDASTSDHNAVYVLDRTAFEGSSVSYRLQKLSNSGQVLGTASFTEQINDTRYFSDAHPVISLAVDSAAHRVYTVVQDMVEDNAEFDVPVAARLVAWSTKPSGGALLQAPGFPQDSITGAALVAGPSALESAEVNSDLYAPAGLAVDPANHDVVIEAQRGPNDIGFGPRGGTTLLQRVVTQGTSAGQLGATWVADSATAPAGEQANGLFTTTSGAFGVGLYQHHFALSRLAQVGANFAAPSPQLITPTPGDRASNADEAHGLDLGNTIAGLNSRESHALTPSGAGSPATQLSNGTYAEDFGETAGQTDPQTEVAPWNGLPFFWTQERGSSNMGVRIFTSSGTILDTIGGAPAGQSCSLGNEALALAAGSKSTLFVLDGTQVQEFAPLAGSGCPQPSGSFTVNGQTAKTLSFPVGTTVTFADTVNRLGETPFRFDWGILNTGTLSLTDLANQITAPAYTWPAPTASYKFTSAGTYQVAATVYGDYGATVLGTVTIKIH